MEEDKKMKKLLALILVLSIALFAFVGCAKEQPAPAPSPAPSEEPNEEPSEEPNEEEPAAEGAVKTGLAVITSLGKSKDATADAEGTAQSDSVIVAVTVDNDGKVVKAVIDTAQTAIKFNAEGKVTSDLTASYKSKQELKEEYGMSKASTIGKEWYEQANTLADYVVGKTVDEIKAIPTDDTGVPTDADLVASVTMKIDGYKDAFEKAMAEAQDLGANAEDKLGLGVVTTIDKSKDATADADGLAQAYSTYTATTFDAEGKITSSILNASQANVNFDATGKITSDLEDPALTKNELGDDYGMRKASPIGKEWFEQAAAFAEYTVGKTVEEVKAFETDETGHNTEADIVSSVTFGIDDFKLILEEALNTAK